MASFFAAALRSKVASLLRPWMEEEPEIDLKLGFLRSSGIARNLLFNPLALNSLIEDSSRLVFKRVWISELSVRVSPCSSPSIVVEVRGVDVTLAQREPAGEGRSVMKESAFRERRDKERKEVIASVDPEGAHLHEILQKLILKTPSGNWLQAAFKMMLIRSCRICFRDISFQLEIMESHRCLLKLDEFTVEPPVCQPSSLFEGFFIILLLQKKESSLCMNCLNLELGLRENVHFARIASLVGVSACTRLVELRPVEFDVQLPSVHIECSPRDIVAFRLVLDLLSPCDIERGRNGQELWRIAAHKIGSLTLNPRLSLEKVVKNVRIWLHYVLGYESLLLLVGFPFSPMLKSDLAKVSCQNKILSLAKRQWHIISELEEKLPADAIGRARRIVRHRLLLRAHARDLELPAGVVATLLSKIYLVLLVLWKIIFSIFQLLNHCMNVWRFSRWCRKSGRSSHPLANISIDDDVLHFYLNVGVLRLTLCSSFTHNVLPSDKAGSNPILSVIESTLFSVSIESFSVIRTFGCMEKSWFVVLGVLKLSHSSASNVSSADGDLAVQRNQPLKKHLNHGTGQKIIFQGDPARRHHLEGGYVRSSLDQINEGSDCVLKNCIDDLWSGWTTICRERQGKSVQHMDRPFVLCEIKSSLLNPPHNIGERRLQRCSFVLGKLNFDMDNRVVISAVLLLTEMWHFGSLSAKGDDRAQHLSHSLSTINKETEDRFEDWLEVCLDKAKMEILRIFPDRNILVGAIIDGANIRISLQGGLSSHATQLVASDPANDASCFTIDVGNVDFAVLPASKAILTAVMGNSDASEAQDEYLWFKEPQLVSSPKAHGNESFTSRGRSALVACLKLCNITVLVSDLGGNQHSDFIGPMMFTLQFSSCRDYIHSLSATEYFHSLVLSGFTSRVAVFVCMKNLRVSLKAVEFLRLAGSYTEIDVDAFSSWYPEDSKRISSFKKNNERKIIEARTPDQTMTPKIAHMLMDVSLEFESINIILNHLANQGNEMSDGASSSTLLNRNMSVILKETFFSDMIDLPDTGIGVFIHKSCAQMSWEGKSLKFLSDISGIQSVIFRQKIQEEFHTKIFDIEEFVDQSCNHLYKFYLSCCTFNMHVGFQDSILPYANGTGLGDGSAYSNPKALCSLELPHSKDSVCRTVVDIGLGDLLLVEHRKNTLQDEVDQAKKLHFSLSVCEELRTINIKIQGGYIFLETLALAAFTQSFKVYFHLIQAVVLQVFNPSHMSPREAKTFALRGSFGRLTNHQNVERTTATLTPTSYSEVHKWFHLSKLKFLKDFSVDLFQFPLILSATDGSGGVQTFDVEVDASLKLMSSGRKMSFDLRQLTILAKHHYDGSLHQASDSRLPHFKSISSAGLLSDVHFGNPTLPSRTTKDKHPILGEFQSGYPTTSQGGIPVDSDVSESMHSYDHNHILKHLAASLEIEKMGSGDGQGSVQVKSYWIGNGSISNFDVTTSLCEIQMLMALVAPLYGISSVKAYNSLKQQSDSRSEGLTGGSDYKVPDGSIVAIKDIQEHMYFAVEAVGRKYRLIGVLHYSLVGERALFRVRYHKGWRSKASSFSLSSLYARNDEGEPLRLNFCSGSGFVEISTSDDKACARWQFYPYMSDAYDPVADLELYGMSSKNYFHFVNQRNSSAVAFVDGRPEFVMRPGHLFKFKLIDEFPHRNEGERVGVANTYSSVTYDANVQGDSSCVDGEKPLLENNLAHIMVTIDRITLTILHEVSDRNYKIALVQSSIGHTHVNAQVLHSKLRIISSSNFATRYFDAQKNLWRELISPVDMNLLYHSRFTSQGSVKMHKKFPVHLFFRMKQVDISLTELSLDIVLYIAGRLNLISPRAIKSSVIFGNCCKLENNSALSLVFHLANNQELVIPGRQSRSIFLSHVALDDQIPESHNLVSVSLAGEDALSTPISLSLSKPSFLAWRTRISSLHDARNIPGPFIVLEVSKNAEEGLLLVVSPLLRIHNKSGFSTELRFWQPQETDAESASILLKNGDSIDDSVASFDALDLSGGSKRALMSLTLGNFLLSMRPDITDYLKGNGLSISASWSEELKGEKAVRFSGILDKLNYRLRKTIGAESKKLLFSTLSCPLKAEGQHVSNLYFLIQTLARDVPLMNPSKMDIKLETMISPVALQMQKEIFIYPTVQIHNFLQSDIHVLLTENHPDHSMTDNLSNFGKQATISCGSNAYFYANPAIIYFTVSLVDQSSKCRPVNTGDWVKKLHKEKSAPDCLDIELDFGGGKYFASLRLSQGDRGILEVLTEKKYKQHFLRVFSLFRWWFLVTISRSYFQATVFTSYVLKNNTGLSLLCYACNQKPSLWSEHTPELGFVLRPMSTESWFLKSNKVSLKCVEEKTSTALLDLDTLSGFTELCLEAEDRRTNCILKLGVSLRPYVHTGLPSQLVCIVPRYVISNESREPILVRQCYLEDELDGVIVIESKEKTAFHMKKINTSKRRTSFFDSILKKHKNWDEDSLVFIQFSLKDMGYEWSGPICVSSLGRFFLKFKPSSANLNTQAESSNGTEERRMVFAAVHIVEENSSLYLRFCMPPDFALPYRIENGLHGASIMYHQKDYMESDLLQSGDSVEYAWDDLNLPHKLVVQIVDLNISREINIDKVCEWKQFFKPRQNKRLVFPLSSDRRVEERKGTIHGSQGLEMFIVGYEVFADGLTRVLRICELSDSYKEEKTLLPSSNIHFRVKYFAIHLLENSRQDPNGSELPDYSKLVVARMEDLSLESFVIDQYKYNRLRIRLFSVDEKWQGAPFAAMLRGSKHDPGLTEDILRVTFILLSGNSSVKQVQYSSIILQPIDLKVDEDTLMRLVPFWRASINDPTARSRQFYFKHFEVHPVKIRASFLPSSSDSDYSSAQETLRSLLHSVIKIPAIESTVVELNGVLLSHALVTFGELLVKCAQHYSWYVIRAVYLAKGSPLLPPAFASLFDDTASSSLDVFFDPSDGSVNLPGLTLGMFKFISKYANSRGISGTKRYFGDLGKTMKTVGSNALFAAVTEISDNVLRGAETSGFNGMVNGFHQGILRLAMEPSLLGAAIMEGGPDRKIKLDHSPGIDESYIEGYLQAMLDVMYKQEYLRVRVSDDQVVLKNLPPNTSVINEIVENVKSFLVSKDLLKGDSSSASSPFRHLRMENEWRLGPTVLTLCEHLFVSFAIRILHREANKFLVGIRSKLKKDDEGESSERAIEKPSRKWALSKFVMSGMIAYLDGRLCRHIPHPIARRIASGFLLSFIDKKDGE